jgi:hypothetical protein
MKRGIKNRLKKMVKQIKSQAALEYLTTYGWAILAAIIALGALAYFGFLNPSNLLPNRCDFGKQLECMDYKINTTGLDSQVSLILRNNFGKPINITGVGGDEIAGSSSVPLFLDVGEASEVVMNLNKPVPVGDKKEVNPVIVFNRVGATNSHNLTGIVFVTVQ